MNYDEYLKTRWEYPYTFKLSKNENQLYFFGEIHSYQDDDPQWETLKSFWTDFLEKTKDQKRIVFTEGGIRPVESSESDAIVKYGGMGLITFLATRESIKIFSPEPEESYKRSELEKEFSRDDIQYYYFARMVAQWSIHKEFEPDFVIYINKYLDTDHRRSGWEGYDFSLQHMRDVHADLFGKVFDENDIKFIRSVSSPVFLHGVTNRVSRRSSEIRDEYIVDQIIKHMNEGYSLFVQFGGNHAVLQKPYLEELLDKNP